MPFLSAEESVHRNGFFSCKKLFEKFSLVSFLKPRMKTKERSVIDEDEKN